MSQLKKDVQLTLLSRVPVMFLSFLSVIFLTRLIGPEGNGVYTFTIAALNLFYTVIGFQLESSLPFFLAKDKENSSGILSAVGMLAIASTLLFSIILTIVVFLIPGGAQWVMPPGQPVVFFFVFILISFSLRRISTLVQASLRGTFRFKSYNLYMLLHQLILATGYGILLFLSVSSQTTLPLLTCFKAILLLELGSTLIGLYILWYNKIISFTINYTPFIKPISALSFKSLLSASGYFLNKRLDVWFVQFYRGTATLGQYGLATQITNFINEAMTPFNQVLIPYIAEAPPDQHSGIVTRTARLNMFIATSAAFLIITTSWLFIPFLFGNAFQQAIPATQILAIGVIFISQRMVFMGYFKSINKMQYPVTAAWAGVVITVILDILLIPPFGIMGAAIATTLSYATSSVYLIIQARQNLKFSLIGILILKKSDLQWLLSKNKKGENP